MGYELRPYQEECIQVIWDAIPNDKYILIQAPCGFGKTILASELIKRLLVQWPKIRIAFLAHRGILITQTRDKLLKVWPESESMIGIASGGIDNNIDTEKPITIGTIQTIVNKVSTTAPYDLIICDEAHRISPMNIKSQYKTFITTMNQYNQNTRILGMTGSPYRLGHGYIYGNLCKKGNLNLFTDLHYRIPIISLQKQGFLCGYRAKVLVDISSDLSNVRKTGDYNINDLSNLMSKQHHVGSAVKALNDYASDRKHVVVFACTIAHAEKLCEAFGEQATIIHSQLSKDDREKAIYDFENGTRRILVNVNVLCLDDKTEILTLQGWKGINDLTYDNDVANWDIDNIYYTKPKNIIKRKRYFNEKMVSIDTKYANFRITEDHKIIWKWQSLNKFNSTPAIDFALKETANRHIPICGLSCDFTFLNDFENNDLSVKKINRLISSNSYNLRRYNGYNYEDSIIEATIRTSHIANRKRKYPNELSLSECKLIGFWVGDGSRTQLKKGGIEYRITASNVYPKIISWFDSVISETGYHVIRKERETYSKVTIWSFARGTGGGCQKVNGLYPIEQYLDKNGSDLLWNLSESQFESFIEGLWMADGLHGDGVKKVRHYWITSTNKSFLDKIQAIAVTKNFRASISGGEKKRNPNHNPLYKISLCKRGFYTSTKNIKIETEFKDEFVWCVTVDSSKIITRRNGKVIVLGNCEGFDSPATDCVIMCRPTCSPSMFVQQLGRGLRPHPDKTDVLILDLANNCLVHGDPDSPKVVIPKPDKKKEEQIIEKKQKVCPACKEAIDPRCTICPVCGYEFVQENNDKVQLTDYDFKEPPKPIFDVEIGEAVFHKHVSRAGNIMVKLNLECYHNNAEIPIHLNHYFQFDFDSHPYARGNSRKVWRKITGDDPPETTDEALERANEFYAGLAALDTIKIQEDGKFMKVVRWS